MNRVALDEEDRPAVSPRSPGHGRIGTHHDVLLWDDSGAAQSRHSGGCTADHAAPGSRQHQPCRGGSAIEALIAACRPATVPTVHRQPGLRPALHAPSVRGAPSQRHTFTPPWAPARACAVVNAPAACTRSSPTAPGESTSRRKVSVTGINPLEDFDSTRPGPVVRASAWPETIAPGPGCWRRGPGSRDLGSGLRSRRPVRDAHEALHAEWWRTLQRSR